MHEGARPAVASDRDAIVGLAESAIDELAPTRGGGLWLARESRPRPVAASIDADLADPGVAVLVGTIDEAVVGYAVARTEPLRDGTRLGRIDDIYVEPGARSVGVGEAMMDAVLAWCVERGCRGVDALALPGNRATKNFFERYGLTARALVVHRSFVEPATPQDGDTP